MKNEMIRSGIVTVILLTVSTVVGMAEPVILSEADKKALLEKLEEIQKSAEESSKDRFVMALDSFRNAIRSDTAAHDLYLKCVEKADFVDMKRGSQEFREWKRKHKDKTDSAEFRRALRHQLNWLLLSIEASAKPEEIEKLGGKALEKLDAIMDDHEMLMPQLALLNKSVLNSVYARAYNINGLAAKDWPLSPLKISDIYEKVVMPPLRKKENIAKLRSAWKKRVEHEGLVVKYWGDLPAGQKAKVKVEKEEVLEAKFTQWKAEGYLQLLWDTEVDCFKAGDEQQAAKKLLDHLAEHIKHKFSIKWAKQFHELVSAGGKKAEGGKE